MYSRSAREGHRVRGHLRHAISLKVVILSSPSASLKRFCSTPTSSDAFFLPFPLRSSDLVGDGGPGRILRTSLSTWMRWLSGTLESDTMSSYSRQASERMDGPAATSDAAEGGSYRLVRRAGRVRRGSYPTGYTYDSCLDGRLARRSRWILDPQVASLCTTMRRFTLTSAVWSFQSQSQSSPPSPSITSVVEGVRLVPFRSPFQPCPHCDPPPSSA